MPVFDLARQPRGTKLPVVLTREEVHAVLTNIRAGRHRACLSLIYSCGLRISEAVSIKVSQIDSKRMVVQVQFGKGARDRYVPLPQSTLELLRRHSRMLSGPSSPMGFSRSESERDSGVGGHPIPAH